MKITSASIYLSTSSVNSANLHTTHSSTYLHTTHLLHATLHTHFNKTSTDWLKYCTVHPPSHHPTQHKRSLANIHGIQLTIWQSYLKINKRKLGDYSLYNLFMSSAFLRAPCRVESVHKEVVNYVTRYTAKPRAELMLTVKYRCSRC